MLRLAIALFFAALLLLTFLSNTIQGLSFPKVAVERPEMGALEKNVSGEGFLEPSQTVKLYSEGDWKVEHIAKKKGDRVRKGETIMSFDTESTQRSLEDERTRREQQLLQLEKIEEEMKIALRDGDPSVSDNLMRELESLRLEMELQQRKIEDLEKKLRNGTRLTAPVDGVLTSLNAAEGAAVGPGQPVAELADDASGYSFGFTADRDNASTLRIGDEVKVWIEDTPERSVQGVISEIEDGSEDGSLKSITVEMTDRGLEPGMRASVSISRMSESMGAQIPKSAVHGDNNGDYVFTVSEADGPLGTAYYVDKTYITIKDENEETVIAEGLMPTDRVVTETSEPIDDGDRVRF